MPALTVKPLTPFIGAEIEGADLTRPVDAETFEQIHRALLDHLVIVFRGQSMSPAQQQTLAHMFGTYSRYDGFAPHPDAEHVQIVQNNATRSDLNSYWHIDSTYLAVPPSITLLHCVTTPDTGGDTLFASLYAAYEMLPERVRTLVDGLTAMYDYAVGHVDDMGTPEGAERVLRARAKHPPVEHPLVAVHPVTKRKALFVDSFYTASINGMPWDVGTDMLKWLQRHSQRVEFQTRIRWQKDSLVIFDNRVCQHYASMDFLMKAWRSGQKDFDRRMHRVTVNAHPNR
jgi:taurine dioxygenase